MNRLSDQRHIKNKVFVLTVVVALSVFLGGCQGNQKSLSGDKKLESKLSKEATIVKIEKKLEPTGRVIYSLGVVPFSVDVKTKAIAKLGDDGWANPVDRNKESWSTDKKYLFAYVENLNIPEKSGRQLLTADRKIVDVPYAGASDGWFIYKNRALLKIGTDWKVFDFKDGKFSNPQSFSPNVVSISPDGKKYVIYEASDSGSFAEKVQNYLGDTVGIYDYTGNKIGEVKTLRDPIWSPDSNFIAYLAFSKDGDLKLKYWDIYIQPVQSNGEDSLPKPYKITYQNVEFAWSTTLSLDGWLP